MAGFLLKVSPPEQLLGALREVAAGRGLLDPAVKTHLGRALDKLGLRDRARAIAYAYESGLISPGEGDA